MCGRGRVSLTPEEIEQRTGIPQTKWRDRERYRPSYNFPPGGWLPVLRRSEGERILQSMKYAINTPFPISDAFKIRWGLVPSFTKKDASTNQYKMINARSERLTVSPVFKRLLSKKRCVVVMNGFYEWHRVTSKKKQPYYIHMGEENTVSFAALYDRWEDPKGEELYTVTIITTNACETLQWMHDRMPVILSDYRSMDLWLTEDLSEYKILDKLLRPYAGVDLIYHPVTEKMGRVTYQAENCFEDIRQQGLTGFYKPDKTDIDRKRAISLKHENEEKPKVKKTKSEGNVEIVASEETKEEVVKTEAESRKRSTSKDEESSRSSRQSTRLLKKRKTTQK